MDKQKKSIVLAMQALYAWEANKKRVPVEELFEFEWLEEQPEDETSIFARLLITGTTENIKAIDDMLAEHLQNWSFSRVGRVDLAILRVSIYILMFQKDQPAPLIIARSLSIARKFASNDSPKFINGILDAILKKVQLPST